MIQLYRLQHMPASSQRANQTPFEQLSESIQLVTRLDRTLCLHEAEVERAIQDFCENRIEVGK